MTFLTFEAICLIALSVVWYISIARMVATGRARPRRTAVVVVLSAVILAGMAAKLIAVQEGQPLDPVFWLYGFCLLTVYFDLQLAALFTQPSASLREAMADEDEPRAAPKLPAIAAIQPA